MYLLIHDFSLRELIMVCIAALAIFATALTSNALQLTAIDIALRVTWTAGDAR